MYKVFFNEKKINFSPQGKITLSTSNVFFNDFSDADKLRKEFLTFIKSDKNEVSWISENPEELLTLFRSNFTRVDAAGGVVIRKNKLLFIFRNEIWDLPKGKIDEGETKEEAAIREVKEECGILDHTIEKSLPTTFHVYQSPYHDTFGEWIFKETHWFEMKYSGNKDGNPQLEENISKIKWFDKKQLSTVLENTYENLKQIINIYFD